uniref:Uncharacterized protein n=1 Tax=Rhabditophanes sp. KR3021 TaxID=114890 RepID=A0AC35U7C1_9BILA
MSYFFDNRQAFASENRSKVSHVTSEGITKIQEDCESNPESWCELAPSRGSYCSSIDAAQMMVIDKNGEVKNDSRSSPIHPQGLGEIEKNLEQVKYRLQKDGLTNVRGNDWIWDWSTKSDQPCPPSRQRFRGTQNNSCLTTPPNSPEPTLFGVQYLDYVEPTSKGYSNYQFMISLVVSNFFTLFLGTTMG